MKFEIGEKESVIDCFESPGANPLVVHLKDVYFNYNKKDRLIKGLNLNIQQGHIYGLLGPSGCGKSTTLKIILGLLRPNSGKVTVFGTKPYTAQSTVPGKLLLLHLGANRNPIERNRFWLHATRLGFDAHNDRNGQFLLLWLFARNAPT